MILCEKIMKHENTVDFWDDVAEDWEIQVGTDGDANRRLNSDPVLWQFAGDVNGLKVLDAGCGTGYFSGLLEKKGAVVTGVDFSEKMIRIARKNNPEIDFDVDSCSELSSQANECFDLLIANYVLMDVEDLESAVNAFYRVLKPNGVAVLVFSHPCFPQARRFTSQETGKLCYAWKNNYFERVRCVDPPWNHFRSEFIWFHRSLSDYWRAFKSAGFAVIDFEEPRIKEDRYEFATNQKMLESCTTRPFSVAFKLKK